MALRLSRVLQRSAARTILSHFSGLKALAQQPLLDTSSPDDKNVTFLSSHPNNLCLSRSYISEMRRSAFEGNIQRLLRNEIQYELERSIPDQPVQKYDEFTVDERPGEQWIRLSRKFGENEEIKVEVTMFDGAVPVKKKGGVDTDDNVELHITMIVDIFKGDGNSVLEFVCSAWSSSIQIQKVFMRAHDRMTGHPYTGPIFKDVDDSLQDSLYDYLETRGINDDLAGFLHAYIKNKDKSEFIRWMGNVSDFIRTE
ncbi:hypothetical protein ACET3Z_026742 [Daucus carota]